jgi:hypothetical protein
VAGQALGAASVVWTNLPAGGVGYCRRPGSRPSQHACIQAACASPRLQPAAPPALVTQVRSLLDDATPLAEIKRALPYGHLMYSDWLVRLEIARGAAAGGAPAGTSWHQLARIWPASGWPAPPAAAAGCRSAGRSSRSSAGRCAALRLRPAARPVPPRGVPRGRRPPSPQRRAPFPSPGPAPPAACCCAWQAWSTCTSTGWCTGT